MIGLHDERHPELYQPRPQRAAILHPAGALDWSNYHHLIAEARAAREADTQHLIVDLGDVEHIGTAGMVALYAVARMAHGTPPCDLEAGWAVIHALAENQPQLRPLGVISPRPPVCQALAQAPFSDFLAIHADLDTALAALVA